MLTVEVKINGLLITAIDCINTAREDSNDAGKTVYRYRAVNFPPDFRKDPIVRTGEVRHRYGDGGNKLAALLLAKAQK